MSIGLIEVVNPKHQVGYDLKGSTWFATNAITSQRKRKYKALFILVMTMKNELILFIVKANDLRYVGSCWKICMKIKM